MNLRTNAMKRLSRESECVKKCYEMSVEKLKGKIFRDIL